MSDRQLQGRRHYGLVVLCALGVLWSGSCKQATTTSPVETNIAPVDHPGTAAKKPAGPVEPAPLLLEDEPASGASDKPAADNSRCFVCHVNYMQEKLAVTHAEKNIGCVRCHGTGDAHIADESWASGGNGTAPDIMYPRNKINASCMHCHAKDKIDTAQHQGVLADTEGKQVCTDCHGTHRLPQRRCKWR